MYLNEEVNVYFSSYALQSFLQLHSFSCTSCVQSMYYVVNKHDRPEYGRQENKIQSFLFEANMFSKFNSA